MKKKRNATPYGSKKYPQYTPGTIEYAKHVYFTHKYGISLDYYKEMLTKQNNTCAICKENNLGENDWFCVDHCHATGKVRGLLCHHCNRALGCLKDRVDYFESAIDYLNKYSFN
jgi:hypothetical protein